MSDIYVRVGPDDQWHWLGVLEEIEFRREFLEKEGRSMIASESCYVQLKEAPVVRMGSL